MWWIFPWGKIIFHTLSLIKGCEEKKSKCVENGHSKLEITRKIKKKYLSLSENWDSDGHFEVLSVSKSSLDQKLQHKIG